MSELGGSHRRTKRCAASNERINAPSDNAKIVRRIVCDEPLFPRNFPQVAGEEIASKVGNPLASGNREGLGWNAIIIRRVDSPREGILREFFESSRKDFFN